MTTTLFTDAWTFHRGDEATGTPVRLPHDAMIGEARSADAATGNHGGYFPGGAYRYRKVWTAPDDAREREYSMRFEGVFGVTRVSVDGREVANNDNPYREFTASLADIAPGETGVIDVQVDNRAAPNSRWYTGSGIYRPVWLESVGPVGFAHDGVRIVTRGISTGPTRTDAAVQVTIHVDGVVPSARLWSAERPHLYDVRDQLKVDDETVDERLIRTGLRVEHPSPFSGTVGR